MEQNKTLTETLSSKLNIPLKELDDLIFQKFGNFNNKFVAKVSNSSLKSRMFKAVKTARPENVFINEFLTKKRENLMYELRNFKRQGRLTSVYSFNGKIYVKYPNNIVAFHVNNLSDMLNPNAQTFEN